MQFFFQLLSSTSLRFLKPKSSLVSLIKQYRQHNWFKQIEVSCRHGNFHDEPDKIIVLKKYYISTIFIKVNYIFQQN